MENEFTNQVNEQSEGGISLSDLFYLLKKNLLLILIVIAVSLIAGFGYGRFINKPTYSATTTAIIQAENTGSTETTNYNYAIALTKSYPDLIKSDIVTPRVAKEALLLRYEQDGTSYKNKKTGEVLTEEAFNRLILAKAKEISNGLTITNRDNSLLLLITYKSKLIDGYTEDEIKAEVVKIANESVVKTKEVFDEEKDGKFVYPNFANKLIQLTFPETSTMSRGLTKILLIAAVIGLVLSLGFVFIRYLIDDTMTSKEDIERVTGVHLLAFIEKSEIKGGKRYGKN